MQCNLTSLAFFVDEAKVCDGVYDCPDRSDEAECPEHIHDAAGMTDITRAPKITGFELTMCQMFPNGDERSGVLINGACLP